VSARGCSIIAFTGPEPTSFKQACFAGPSEVTWKSPIVASGSWRKNRARIDNLYLSRVPEFIEFKRRTRPTSGNRPVENPPKLVADLITSRGTPEERIEAAYAEMNGALRQSC
jgi:restriction endonuclease Mrr